LQVKQINHISGQTNKCILQKKHMKIIQHRNRKKPFIQDSGMCLFKNVTKLSKYTFNSFFFV
jgi:hypothetical protein